MDQYISHTAKTSDLDENDVSFSSNPVSEDEQKNSESKIVLKPFFSKSLKKERKPKKTKRVIDEESVNEQHPRLDIPSTSTLSSVDKVVDVLKKTPVKKGEAVIGTSNLSVRKKPRRSNKKLAEDWEPKQKLLDAIFDYHTVKKSELTLLFSVP